MYWPKLQRDMARLGFVVSQIREIEDTRQKGNCILDKSALGSPTCAFGGNPPSGGTGEARLPWDRVFPELVSLWEMITDVRLERLVLLVSILRSILCTVEKELLSRGQEAISTEEHTVKIPTILQTVRDACVPFILKDTIDQIDTARRRIANAVFLSDIRAQMSAVSDVLSREFGKRSMAIIPPSKADMLLEVEFNWARIWAKFESTERPAREGVEAYALGLNDACVYHMMMVLEPGLRALSRRLDVKYQRESWHRIIEDIESALRALAGSRGRTPPGAKPSSPAAAARLRADVTLFSTAAMEFTWFREAWRNHVAHGRAMYDENVALSVMTHVRSFMERLSARLRERRR